MNRSAVVLLLVSIGVFGCGRGSSGAKCGDGTFRDGGKCVPFDPDDETAPTTTASPDGGEFATLPGTVTLTTDEPAIIYYTLDGSAPGPGGPNSVNEAVLSGIADDTTVRFYAVDPAGNEEAPKQSLYSLDTFVTPASGVSLAFTGDDASLTWTNPADPDFAGVVVARVTGIPGAPEKGTAYVVGDDLSSGTEVVYVGTGTSYADADRVVGVHRYFVWTFDAALNYGRTAGATRVLPFAAQTANISVNTTNDTATVTVPPSVLGLAATAAYAAGTSTLTLNLAITNTTTRTLFNPKIELTALSEGTLSDADGTLTGPFRYFGPEGLATGAAVNRDFVITGVTAAAVTLDISIHDSRMLLTGLYRSDDMAGLADLQTGAEVGVIVGLDSFRGRPAGLAHARAGFVSPDGRYFYASSRHSARISIIDLTTLQEVGGVTVPTLRGKRSIAAMTHNASFTEIYAAVTDGGHSYSYNGAECELLAVRIDVASLAETGRLSLGTMVTGRAQGIALSPDETRVALSVYAHEYEDRGQVHFVDVQDWTAVDTDDVTEGTQPVDTFTNDDLLPVGLAFSTSGNAVYVGSNADNASALLGIISLPDFSLTTVPLVVGASQPSVVGGRVWLAGGLVTALEAYNWDSQAIEPVAGYTSEEVHSVIAAPGGKLLIKHKTSGTSSLVDPVTGAEELSLSVSGSSNYTQLQALTPF